MYLRLTSLDHRTHFQHTTALLLTMEYTRLPTIIGEALHQVMESLHRICIRGTLMESTKMVT